MAQAAPIQGIAPGSLNPQVVHQKVITELSKVRNIGERIGNPTLAINKLPDKTLRQRIAVEAGSEFNIAGKSSELIEISAQITTALKTAGKSIGKSTKTIFEAKAKILKAIGEVEIAIASGKSSIDDAFKKRAEIIVQQSLVIADKGGLDDKGLALENIQFLEENFRTVPVVATALGKHGVKISALKTELTNPALVPFVAKAAAGGSTPPGLGRRDNLPPEGLPGTRAAA